MADCCIKLSVLIILYLNVSLNQSFYTDCWLWAAIVVRMIVTPTELNNNVWIAHFLL